jgi:hypothetical protein
MRRRLFAGSSVPDAPNRGTRAAQDNAPRTDESSMHPWHQAVLCRSSYLFLVSWSLCGLVLKIRQKTRRATKVSQTLCFSPLFFAKHGLNSRKQPQLSDVDAPFADKG